MNNLKLLILISCAIFTAPFTYGDGIHVGGGDGTVTLPSGEIVVVDPFVMEDNRMISRDTNFDLYLKNAKSLISLYSVCKKNKTAGKSLGNSLDDFSSVRLVNNLPEEEECKLESFNTDSTSIPEGSTQTLAACTVGKITYIRKDIFGKMKLIDQMAIYIHERMHAALSETPRELGLSFGKTHLAIFALTNGMKTVLHRLELQRAGDRSPISDTEVLSIMELVRAFNTLGETCDTTFHPVAWKNGGGLISEPTSVYNIAPETFIGVGSLVNSTIFNIESNVSIVESIVSSSKSLTILENGLINNSLIANGTDIVLAKKVKIESSELMSRSHTDVGENTTIVNSSVRANRNLEISPSVNIEKTWLEIQPPGVATIFRNYKYQYDVILGDIYVGKNTKLLGVTFGTAGVEFKKTNDRLAFDIIFGSEIELSELQFPTFITANWEYAKEGKIENLIKSPHSPYSINFADKLIIDRTQNPFRGCLSGQAKVTNKIVAINNENEFLTKLCH